MLTGRIVFSPFYLLFSKDLFCYSKIKSKNKPGVTAGSVTGHVIIVYALLGSELRNKKY